jgi:signal transduction histidine kinase
LPASWADWTRRALWPAGIVVGLAAEYVSGFDVPALADLATGWIVLACGLLLWRRAPRRATGPLLAATGLTWFAGNFTGALLYLHRGPLIHALVPSPRAVMIAGYAVTPLWGNEVATIILSAALAFTGRRGPPLALALVLAAGALARLAFPGGDADHVALLAYEVMLCGIAIALLTASRRGGLADLVVELGDHPSPSLRDGLAAALGDPTLELGFWHDGAYVDARGQPVELPQPGARRVATLVDRDGRPLAALVHDDDPALAEAVAAGARLVESNARLQGEVQAQVVELEASRRRLLAAGDEERRRLEQRLREGAGRRLARLAKTLEPLPAERARDVLEHTRADLHKLAAGLHPAQTGLRDAVAALIRDGSVPVALTLPEERLAPDVEAVAYFVCAEGLANVTKYAEATRVEIRVEHVDGRVVVEVADDGVGGADPERGSGLRGLSDRLQARGGRLRVHSPVGGGTRLAAEIPLDQSILRQGLPPQ